MAQKQAAQEQWGVKKLLLKKTVVLLIAHANRHTHPILLMSNSQFQDYLGFFLWITIVFSVLGLEFISFLMFLPAKWSNKLQSYWILAWSLLFLFTAAAMAMAISHNYAALLVFVPGMWKVGFPQTITLMYLSPNNKSLNSWERIGYSMNSLGLLTHHAAGVLAISMAITRVINTMDNHVVLDAIMIAMVQHCFFLVLHQEECLCCSGDHPGDLVFEWITLSNLEDLYSHSLEEHFLLTTGFF